MINGDFSGLLGTNRAITNSLGVASREGDGSTFTLDLPLTVA